MADRKYWLIKVYYSTEKKFEDTVPFGSMTEPAIIRMLGRLVAKHCLSDREIVSGSVSRNSKRYVDYFRHQRERGPYSPRKRLTLSMGDGPTATATVLTEGELRSLGLWKEP